MPDFADLELEKIEKEIHKTYTQAQKELQEKWDKYMAKAQPKVDKALDAYNDAKAFGTAEEIDKAKEKYEKASLNMTLQNAHYQEMVNQTTNKLAETNQIALSYINDQMPKVYCHSYNEFADQHIAGYSFELVNEDAVKYLVKSGNTNLLPQKKLNFEKDKAWNTKQINSQVLQGILQGESMDEISKRLFSVIHDPKETNKNIVHKNEVSARRAAQTMVTGAQNKGRQDSFERASNDGVKMKRIWVAAHDDRTRTSHLDLHGTSVAVDEPFHSMYGDIMYPGDPSADPRDVYNCRCAIRVKVLGFDWSKQKEKESDDIDSKELTFEEKLNNIQTVNFNLKPSNNSDMIKVPIDLDEKPAAFDKVGLDNKDYLHFLKQVGELPFEEQEIPLSDVIATQSIVNKQGVLKSLGSTEPIDVVLVDGKYYIYNGHHRAAAAIINGDDKILAKVRLVDKQSASKPDLGMYQDKSMTATFYSVKAENKDLGKEFWAVLQAEDKPSDTWKQYLIGTAPKEITEKLDKILLQHKGEGAWTKPVSAKKLVFKAEYNIDNVYDLPSDIWDKLANVYSAKYEKNGYKYISDLWKAYKAGEIKNADLDKIFKEEATKVTKKVAKTKAAAEVGDDLVKAQSQLAVAEGNLNSVPNKTYTGIWKDPVSLSDYEAKAASIQAKKQWYYDEIEKLDKKAMAGDITYETANVKIAQYEKYIDDLTEFETQGKLYAQYAKEYQTAFDKVKKLTPVSETFGPDAYSAARKNAALWAKNDAEYRTIDKYYEKEAKKVHGAKTTAEHEGYYHYTWGSGPFNQPLAGFDGSWSESSFKGPGKVNIDSNGYGSKIRGLTSLCEKSKYDKDFWVQSGQSTDTLAGFLELPRDIFNGMSDADLQQFVGIEKEIPQFISGAINKGGGSYTPGNMLFNIYCPAGSEALYVRSDGHFGKHEHEMILQRGGTYKITKIYWGTDKVHGGRKLIVDLELHPEKGYNKFQQKK